MPLQLSVVEAKRGPALMLDFSITGSENEEEEFSNAFKSKAFNIDNTAEVWFKFKHDETEQSEFNLLTTSILMRKHKSVTDSIVNLNVTCKALNYCKKLTCPEYLTYGIYMGKIQIPILKPYSLRITMNVTKKEAITFAKLFDDTDLVDFHLITEEGSVAVHRACLAMHSDMFKTMLLGKWKETAEGRIELKGISLQTLQQLKQYIYLGTLPDDVRQLLLLAKCYLLDSLKQDCLMKLALTVSPENLYELQDFAFDNHVIELSRMLLHLATNDTVQAAHDIDSKNKIIEDAPETKSDG